MELIDKSAIVAEINKRIIDAPINHIGHQRVWAYNDVKDIIGTLEVKEVDLDRAIDKWIDDAAITHEDCSITDVISTAKHFFELGIKTKKGE